MSVLPPPSDAAAARPHLSIGFCVELRILKRAHIGRRGAPSSGSPSTAPPFCGTMATLEVPTLPLSVTESGDFSGSGLSPTAVGALDAGINTISGDTAGGAPFPDSDFFSNRDRGSLHDLGNDRGDRRSRRRQF